MTCDVIASTLATHTLYSKVSIHEAPEALHDMAFTLVLVRLRLHICIGFYAYVFLSWRQKRGGGATPAQYFLLVVKQLICVVHEMPRH